MIPTVELTAQTPFRPLSLADELLLIDLSSIAHPTWHVSQNEPDPNYTSRKTVERIRALASQHPHAAVCCDSGRSFRYDVDPSYKANRPESIAPLQHQIKLAQETLIADGFPVWSVRGFEGDDLIASATARALEIDETTVLIASDDKDLLALVGPRVSVHRVTSGVRMDAEAVKAKLGVEPHQVRDYLSLVGDKSDNVIGAKGIGEKRAAELLNLFGSLDAVYEAMAHGQAGLSPSIRTALVEFKPRLPVVRELIALRADVPIPFEEIAAERVAKDALPEEYGMEDVIAEAETERRPDVATTEVQGSASAVPEKGNGGPAPSQSLAVREQPDVLAPPPAEWSKQLEPRSLREAQSLATSMYQARLFMGYGNPPAVLSTILAGREFGLQAIASLRGLHIVEGRHFIAADLIRGLVLRSGLAKYFRCTERTATRATFVTKRGDDPEMTLSYTIEEGRAAFTGDDAKWNKSGWGRNPSDMLVARAGAKLARLVYPDVIFAMYAAEEDDVRD